MLQDFAEKCNRSGEKQMHLMLISHKEIANYIDKLPKQKVDGWRGVSERFKHIHLNNNFMQTYEIIESAIQKKNLVGINSVGNIKQVLEGCIRDIKNIIFLVMLRRSKLKRLCMDVIRYIQYQRLSCRDYQRELRKMKELCLLSFLLRETLPYRLFG